LNLAVWNSGLVAKSIEKIIVNLSKSCNVFVICSSEFEKQNLQKKINNHVKEIVSTSDYFSHSKNISSKTKVLDEAKYFESKFNLKYIDIIKSDRHIGKGFVKGAWYPESNLSSQSDYFSSLKLITQGIKFFDDFFSTYRIDAIVLEVASLNTKIACSVARKKNIKIRVPHPSRIDDWYFFASSEFIDFPGLKEVFKKNSNLNLSEQLEGCIGANDSYDIAKKEISNYLDYSSFIYTLRSLAYQCLQELYKYIIGNKKYSNYIFSQKLLAVWLYHTGIKKAKRENYFELSRADNLNYIIFPLQLEPESSIMVMTPEFDSQEHLVHLLASNLPAGWILIIKEHPLALGTRPDGYIDRISSYPNTLCASPFDNSLDWCRKSKAVATINGSLAYEACFQGIPVISFGKHNLINFLSYVFQVDSYKSLQESLNKICSGKIDSKEKRLKQGITLKKSITDVSFKLNASEFYSGYADSEKIDLFSLKLIKSLENND